MFSGHNKNLLIIIIIMSILRFKYKISESKYQFSNSNKNFQNSNINFEFKCHFSKFKYTLKSPCNISRGVTNLVIIMNNGTY
jgi:hypothetical protein